MKLSFNDETYLFTMKLIYCAEVLKSLMLQGFSYIEKARWLCIKTIVLIWCGKQDLNLHEESPH